ncbi:MAG: FKBP-type peptidyl-prolyl cis-trans isomerase [Desulfuromonas sp.]|nr:FKBP-type peptidyl-prolyl cis-trans isomerase [Desulfuromonas sp.]
MRLLIVLLVGCGLMLSGCNEEKKKTVSKLETLQQKVSYSIGYDIAKNFKENDFALDFDLLNAGMQDADSGAVAKLDQEQMAATMAEFQQFMVEKQQKKIAGLAEENSAAGQAFLDENKGKEGVVTLESGLQYKILQAGTGSKPTLEDEVQVHYRGTLIDGTQFDSSYDRGEPVEFPVSRVIAGWTEALQLMPVGSKWQLFIPAQLAYGSQAMGNVIEPNSVLIFEVELLNIVGAEPAAAGTPAQTPED